MYFWAVKQPKRNTKNLTAEINKGLYSYWK